MGEDGNGKEEAKKTGLEGTGLSLPGSSHGNLRSASNDQQLKRILDSLKSSKSPVSMATPILHPLVSCLLPQVLDSLNRLLSTMVLHGVVFAVRFFHPSVASAMNSRILLLSMLILMNAQKQHKTFDTLQPSIFTGMEKRLMRCLEQEKRDCMIGYGCILDSDLPGYWFWAQYFLYLFSNIDLFPIFMLRCQTENSKVYVGVFSSWSSLVTNSIISELV